MRRMVLGLAAIAVITISPAAANAQGRPSGDWHHDRDSHRDTRRDNHRFADSATVLDTNGGEWALYNNRSWEADSYNDWWHDRPDRAFPRWMSRNQDCSRQWWSGDTLRC